MQPKRNHTNIKQLSTDINTLGNLLEANEAKLTLTASNTQPISIQSNSLPAIIPQRLTRKQNKIWANLSTKPKHISIQARTEISNYTNNTREKITTDILHNHIPQQTLTHYNNIQSLNQLQKDDTIIIKKSDKTNKLVIMDKQQYLVKAYEHLHNTNHYTHITTRTQQELIQSTTSSYNKIIEAITRSNLSKDNKQELIKYTRPHSKQVRFPMMYFNPKTHKEGNPLRPIVTGIKWTTENTAILIDELLKPHISTQPHLPKDSFAFISTIENMQHELLAYDHKDIQLVTFDVTSLYTNIPQYHAIQRITDLFTSTPHIIPTSIITQMATYIITNNYFTFNSEIYKQSHGIAMGNPAGASIANIYMIEWDRILRTQAAFHTHTLNYQRYLDDGFLIWIGTQEELTSFITQTNNIDRNIQIIANYGKQVTYLDIELTLTTNIIILTRTHRKPTAAQTYLDYKSSHPKHIKNNLPSSIYF